MFNLREKRIFEKILYSKISLGALVVVLLFSLNAAWGVYEKYREAAKNRDRELSSNALVEARVNALQEEVALLQTDRGIEKTIREEFGFAEDGEGVIVLVGEAPRENAAAPRRTSFLGSVWESVRNIRFRM